MSDPIFCPEDSQASDTATPGPEVLVLSGHLGASDVEIQEIARKVCSALGGDTQLVTSQNSEVQDIMVAYANRRSVPVSEGEERPNPQEIQDRLAATGALDAIRDVAVRAMDDGNDATVATGNIVILDHETRRWEPFAQDVEQAFENAFSAPPTPASGTAPSSDKPRGFNY